jgi:hypothetical protein
MQHFWKITAALWLLSGMGTGLFAESRFSVEVLQPQITVEVVPPQDETISAGPPFIVVAYTTQICGPCNRWKASEKDKLITAGVRVEYLDANNLSPEWSAWVDKARRDHNMPINTVPHFFVLSAKDRTLIGKPLSGFKSAVYLISVGTRRNFMAPPKKQNLTYNPPAYQATHGDMVALHNMLHGGGSWTWPGDLAQHLQHSHGVTLFPPRRETPNFKPAIWALSSPPWEVGLKPIRRSFRSSCPSGNCPR